jgi:hypothetical protein
VAPPGCRASPLRAAESSEGAPEWPYPGGPRLVTRLRGGSAWRASSRTNKVVGAPMVAWTSGHRSLPGRPHVSDASGPLLHQRGHAEVTPPPLPPSCLLVRHLSKSAEEQRA